MLELNNIYQGDCLELMKSIPDKSIDLVLTDPPYGMEFQSNYRVEKHLKIANDNNLDWLSDFMDESFRVLKDDSHVYMFCSWHNIDKFKAEFESRFNLKNIIIWEKNNTGMGDLEGSYAPKYEMVLFGAKGNRKLNGSRKPDVLRYNRTNNELHPTQKPVDLMGNFIMASSDINYTILDPFSGSGTTAIACIKTNRNFICIEKEPKYVEISRKRVESELDKYKLAI